MEKKSEMRTCEVCGQRFPVRRLVPGGAVRDVISSEIRRDHPGWSSGSYICRHDLTRYRTEYVHGLLQSEKGELTGLEQEIVKSMRDHELLTKNMDVEFGHAWSFGERMADRIAAFGGSWAYLTIFGVFLVVWIVANTVVLVVRPPDPYPFIFLNLVLSCLSAIQAPIILMSQNRQDAKDRLRSQHDYQVNLKAELEIRHLHEKMDHLMSNQWARLTRIQQIQLDLLAEMGKKK